MTTTHTRSNNALRSIPPRMNHNNPVPGPPLNTRLGSTTRGPNNYGSPRGAPVGAIPLKDLVQWRSGAATSQQQYAQTRLPRGRA